MNALGHDIYIRPQGSQGVVLLDDLKPAALERMKADGFRPCAVVETSPGNFQAWVRLSEKPIDPQAATFAARELATRYGGDLNSAHSEHYGRLAGYTNQKPEHLRADGQSPFVLLVEAIQRIAEKGRELLAQVRETLHRVLVDRERESRQDAIKKTAEKGLGGVSGGFSAVDEYRRQASALAARYGANADFSRLDYMIARSMAEKEYSPDQVRRAMEEASPGLAERKAGHLEDYLSRTVTKAFQEVERNMDKSGLEL